MGKLVSSLLPIGGTSAAGGTDNTKQQMDLKNEEGRHEIVSTGIRKSDESVQNLKIA